MVWRQKNLAVDIDGITIKDEFLNNNDSSKNSFFFLEKDNQPYNFTILN